MNSSRVLLGIPMLLLLWFTQVSLAEEAVSPGVSFVSPNGRSCVQVEGVAGLPRFAIKDRETGRMDNSIVSTGPLYLHWAANSRCFVAVEHIAKGSRGRVIYLAGDRWSDVKVEPPSEDKVDTTVIKLQLGTDSVHYVFAVRKLARDWTPIDYWLCELDISLG